MYIKRGNHVGVQFALSTKRRLSLPLAHVHALRNSSTFIPFSPMESETYNHIDFTLSIKLMPDNFTFQ